MHTLIFRANTYQWSKTRLSTYPHDILSATISSMNMFVLLIDGRVWTTFRLHMHLYVPPTTTDCGTLKVVSDALLRLDLGGRGVCMLCGSKYEANRIAQCGDYCAR